MTAKCICLSKSVTSDALITLMCADKQAAGITVPEKSRWMI